MNVSHAQIFHQNLDSPYRLNLSLPSPNYLKSSNLPHSQRVDDGPSIILRSRTLQHRLWKGTSAVDLSEWSAEHLHLSHTTRFDQISSMFRKSAGSTYAGAKAASQAPLLTE